MALVGLANSEVEAVLIIVGDVTVTSAAMAEAPFETNRKNELANGSRIVVEVFMGSFSRKGRNMQAARFMDESSCRCWGKRRWESMARCGPEGAEPSVAGHPDESKDFMEQPF